MSDAPRYSDKLTMTEFRIAALAEIDLEAMLWESREPDDDLERRYHEADKAALREIDRLKIAGEYELERRRLVALLDPPQPAFVQLIERIDASDFSPWENFYSGLNSPDPDQRARFERLYEKEKMSGRALHEARHILECLEPAKRKREGRPKAIPPWRNVVEHLDAMRLAVAGGASIAQAASEAAIREGRVNADSRAQYFERRYRQRMALREIK
jgi:hypothetical protein